MMSKLTAQDDDQNKLFKPKIYQSKRREDRHITFTIKTMVREIIKIDKGQIVEIGEYCPVVEYNMDRMTETDKGIIRTVEVIFEDEILERICSQISPVWQITGVKIIEVDIEVVMEMIIVKEVEVALGIDSIPMILEGMIEVIVGLDQAQKLVPIEIE